MLTRERAEAFAREWVDAWNAHDLDRILAHWREDARFRSPLVATVMGREDTTIVGKQQLREYWSRGLAAFPDLHFELHTGSSAATASCSATATIAARRAPR